MDLTYTSVTKFFVDLKALFLDAGMTVARTVGNTDLVFDAGGGVFLRFQKIDVGETVVAIGFEYGTDPDILAALAMNAERCIPFTVTPNAEFGPTTFWSPDEKFLAFLFSGSGPERYRVDLRIPEMSASVFHQNHLNPQFQPNFKDTGGPYIAAGA